MTSITRENGLMLSLSGGVEIQLARFRNDRLAGYTPVDKVLSILREEEFFVRHKLDQNSHLQSMFVAKCWNMCHGEPGRTQRPPSSGPNLSHVSHAPSLVLANILLTLIPRRRPSCRLIIRQRHRSRQLRLHIILTLLLQPIGLRTHAALPPRHGARFMHRAAECQVPHIIVLLRIRVRFLALLRRGVCVVVPPPGDEAAECRLRGPLEPAEAPERARDMLFKCLLLAVGAFSRMSSPSSSSSSLGSCQVSRSMSPPLSVVPVL